MLDRGATHAGPHPTASGALTRLAYARAKAAGLDAEAILRRAHLTLRQIEDSSARLKVRDQISFLNLVANDLQDDFLGFHLALEPDLREIGWLYYVAASSENLSEALKQAARYSSIVNEGISLHYVDNGHPAVTIKYVGVSRHLDRHQIESIATLMLRMCRKLTGLRLTPMQVKFIHHRDRICPEFGDFFGCKLEFGASTDEAVFATSLRDTPITSADPFLNKLLITYCEEALARRQAHRPSFLSCVENAIVPLLPHGKARSDEIAQRLGISQRTLARNLSAEGSTFSGVLDSLRRDLADRYLADKDLSISEIAWLLGYQEVSAFTHAFRRWTGRSPRYVRARELSDCKPAPTR
jgi:AraC-like DNA-binding protein